MSVELADVVDRNDVRVSERGGGLCFALESPAHDRVREIIREELDRDGAVQTVVDRTIHDAHAAPAEHGLDAVRANDRAGFKSHGCARASLSQGTS